MDPRANSTGDPPPSALLSPIQAQQLPPPRQQQHPRQRPNKTANACEACRSAKVKCQASSQFGICRRCLDSKRECVFKTGPRTRRPRQSKRIKPESATTTTSTANPAASSLNLAPVSATAQNPSTPAPATGPGPGPGPSKTFTIDIPIPALEEVTDAFEELRVYHGAAIDGLGPAMDSSSEEDDDFHRGEGDGDGNLSMTGTGTTTGGGATEEGSVVSSHASSLPVGASALSAPPATAPTAKPRRTMVSSHLGLRPQFNLDSGAALLKTFRETMIPTFPCVVLDEHLTVADMARDKPFVLLAALAAASSSRTLQGHSLYDEEFRKILGLKFVAGGERSAELLEGLVVYIAWYPFHLRPRNKQAFQYVRMAVDIVNDLEIEQDASDLHEGITAERRTLVRLYLAIYFISSYSASSWNRTPSMAYTAFTAQCVQLFLSSPHPGDVVLAWKVRLQRLTEEIHELRKIRKGDASTTYQIDLMVKGIESQLAEWELGVPSAIASNPSIRISLLFCRIFILGAPLLKIPAAKAPAVDTSPFRASVARLMSVLAPLHALYDHFAGLPPGNINAFCGPDWGSLILAIVLGYRMSFPLAECPGWDDGAARREVRFGEYLDKLCQMGGNEAGEDIAARLASSASGSGGAAGPVPGPMDILSASKVVMEMLRRKYHKRVAKLDYSRHHPQTQPQARQHQGMMAALWAAATGTFAQQPALATVDRLNTASGTPTSGCPMLDGSVESFLPCWDETFAPDYLAISGAAGHGQVGMAPLGDIAGEADYPDLWATISMGWAEAGAEFPNM